MSGVVCPRCSDLVALGAVYCPSCGTRVIEPRPVGDPHPFHGSMTPGRLRIRMEAAYALKRLDAKRSGRR